VLFGFVVLPIIFVRMSVTPRSSRTGLTGPPATTPVPFLAGFKRTTADSYLPITSCGIVPSIRGTLIRCFFASAIALAIEGGTSFAFPCPNPTCPFLSPTTASVENENLLPPSTTRVVLLISTTFSSSVSSAGFIGSIFCLSSISLSIFFTPI